MEFPVNIESQEQFDALVKDRITRAERKAVEPFADYDNLKSAAAEFEQQKADLEKQLNEVTAAKEAAEGKVQQFETDKQVNGWRTEVAEAAGVPADALRGSTKEEFEAHAEQLKPLITAAKAGPIVTDVGDSPQSAKPRSSWSSLLESIDEQRQT